MDIDPFLQVSLGASSIIKTSVKTNDLNPEWNEKFIVPVCHHADILKIKVSSSRYFVVIIDNSSFR